MDPAKLKSVKRGKFHQLRYDDNPMETKATCYLFTIT